MGIFSFKRKGKTAEAEAEAAATLAYDREGYLPAPAKAEDGSVRREKVLLFYNPHAGNGMFKNNLDVIIERFQANNFQVTPVRAAKGFPLDQAMKEMDVSKYRQVIAAGGDGTINICVDAMLKNNIDLPLAIFPIGTANDFAYYFDIPTTIEGMVDVAVGHHFTYTDVGVCNDKYFINVAAMGALVDVSQKTDPNLKNTLGVLAYYLKGLTEIVSLRSLPVRLTTPDKTYYETMLFMVVMNGESAGGFKRISPNSLINDGKLNVVMFRKMPIVELAPLFAKVLQGRHITDRRVLAFSTEELLVESPVEISTDVDGEHGATLPLHFSVLPGKLRILTADPKK